MTQPLVLGLLSSSVPIWHRRAEMSVSPGKLIFRSVMVARSEGKEEKGRNMKERGEKGWLDERCGVRWQEKERYG